MSDWVKSMNCEQEICFRFKDSNRFKRIEKIYNANNSHMRIVMAVVISDKIDFKTSNVIR